MATTTTTTTATMAAAATTTTTTTTMATMATATSGGGGGGVSSARHECVCVCVEREEKCTVHTPSHAHRSFSRRCAHTHSLSSLTAICYGAFVREVLLLLLFLSVPIFS